MFISSSCILSQTYSPIPKCMLYFYFVFLSISFFFPLNLLSQLQHCTFLLIFHGVAFFIWFYWLSCYFIPIASFVADALLFVLRILKGPFFFSTLLLFQVLLPIKHSFFSISLITLFFVFHSFIFFLMKSLISLEIFYQDETYAIFLSAHLFCSVVALTAFLHLHYCLKLPIFSLPKH